MATGLSITTRFPRPASHLHFCRPRVVIDGHVTKTRWGTKLFKLEPGTHSVEIYFRYLWMAKCGRNSLEVTVEDGQIRNVDFYMPPLIFLKGRMTLTS